MSLVIMFVVKKEKKEEKEKKEKVIGKKRKGIGIETFGSKLWKVY